ncbi:MAG: hypothetical protein U1A78_15950 [Polyangia bacterium]
MRPARLVPWLLIALLAPGAARAVPPDPLDFPARAAAQEAAGDPSSLVEAAALRRALGQPELAVVDTERFLARLAKDPHDAVPAVAAYLDGLADPALAPEPADREAALRRLLAALPGSSRVPAVAAVRARAEVLLAAHLWPQSCPLDPARRDGDACVERIDAAREFHDRLSAERAAARRAGRRPLTRHLACYDPPRFRYVVHPRLPALAREAQALVESALCRALPLRKGPSDRPSDLALQDTLAHALFLRAEPRFEAAVAKQAPTGLVFDPSRPRATAASKARFGAWLRVRAPKSMMVPRERPLYEAVLARSVPAWSLAAHTRRAQLLFDLNDQISRPLPASPPPPPPPGMTRDEWDRIFEGAWCEPTPDHLERPLTEALGDCLAASADFPDSPFARTCLGLNYALRPSEHSRAREIFAPPAATPPLAAVLYLPSPIR